MDRSTPAPYILRTTIAIPLFFFLLLRLPPTSTLFPYTTLFRSSFLRRAPRPASRIVQRVRPEAQRRSRLREVSRVTRLCEKLARLEINLLQYSVTFRPGTGHGFAGSGPAPRVPVSRVTLRAASAGEAVGATFLLRPCHGEDSRRHHLHAGK